MKAFTLIETLVAVTIITMAVAGPLAATGTSLAAAYTARDKLLASYLAQEAIEYVRGIRDDAYLNDPTDDWNLFLGEVAACDGGTTCSIDPIGGVSPCSGVSCVVVRDTTDPSNRYRQGAAGGTNTAFSRTVTFSAAALGLEEKVMATVSWTTNGKPFSVSITDHLTSWH